MFYVKCESKFLIHLLLWERISYFCCKSCLFCCFGLLGSYTVVKNDDSVTDAKKAINMLSIVHDSEETTHTI